jgi:comEA protein
MFYAIPVYKFPANGNTSKERIIMKRKLFFFLEKLQISKNERVAVSVLIVMIVCTSSMSLIWNPGPQYSETEYAKLERIFEEKSRDFEQDRAMILARYEPLDGNEKGIDAVEKSNMALSDTIPPPENEAETVSANNLIDINSATASKLQELPGIGPAYSKRIVEWRNENGQFTSFDQLLEIKGIGEKRLANIKPLITL